MCQRLNVKLTFSTCSNEYSFELENADGISVIIPFANSFHALKKIAFLNN